MSISIRSASANRELEEELLIRPKEPIRKLGKVPAGPGTDEEFVEIYRAESRGKGIRVHGNEIDCGGFFSLATIDAWIEARPGDFATGFLTIYREVRTQLGD